MGDEKPSDAIFSREELKIVNTLTEREMGGEDEESRTSKGFVYSIRGTLGFATVLVVVYVAQVAATEFIGYETTYRVVSEYIRTNSGLYVYGSHLVHSSLSHLFWNVVFLLIGGAVTERKVGWRKLIVFVYGAGLLANVFSPILGFGGFGIGISGATFGLWTFLGLVYFDGVGRDDEENPKTNFGLALLGIAYGSMGVAQYVGVISAPPGAAKGAHLLGIILGVIWFTFHQLSPELDSAKMLPKT